MALAGRMAGGGNREVGMNGRESGEVRLEARHKPSGENSRFSGEGLAFGEYLRCMAEMLRRAHVRLGTAEL